MSDYGLLQLYRRTKVFLFYLYSTMTELIHSHLTSHNLLCHLYCLFSQLSNIFITSNTIILFEVLLYDRKGVFNGVEVRRVRRKKFTFASSVLNKFLNIGCFLTIKNIKH